MSSTTYTTVAKRATAEFIEKRSRFIGHISPASTEEEALSFIKEISSQHKDASHNVWAYRLKSGGKRYSDDGEPQGSAGVPTLQALEKADITDACVVVTRYFGGTLLGGGGLVRAYSHSVTIAMEAAELLCMLPCCKVEILCEYGLYGKLTYLLPDFTAVVEESDFGSEVRLVVRLPELNLAALEKSIQELSNGQVTPTVLERFFGSIK